MAALRSQCCVLVLALMFLPQPAGAEIYKWVDENGNVHFGDRPVDSTVAENAERVELHQSYTPPPRSGEEQAEMEAAQQQRWQQYTEQKSRDEEAAAQRSAEALQAKKQHCDDLAAQVKRLSGVQPAADGRPVLTYLIRDGKSLTAAEQEAFVAELRKKMREAGC